jgi:hypothetical protein
MRAHLALAIRDKQIHLTNIKRDAMKEVTFP